MKHYGLHKKIVLIFLLSIITTGCLIVLTWNFQTTNIQLDSVIPDRQLGLIMTHNQPIPTANQIKSVLKTEHHNEQLLLDGITIDDISVNSAIVTGINSPVENIHYRGTVTINFVVKNVTNLTAIITKHHLGTIMTGAASLPSEQQIKTAVQQYNPDCDGNLFEIDQISQTEATLSGINDQYHWYTDVVKVDYQIRQTIALSNLIHQHQLGCIELQQACQPTAQQVLAALIKDNESILFNWSELQVTQITRTSAIVTSTNPTYVGHLNLQFTSHQTLDLEQQIKSVHLGTIAIGHQQVPTTAQIKIAIQKANPNCDINCLFISEITDHYAIVQGIKQTNISYYNQVVVDYQLNRIIALKTVLANVNLGTIAIGRKTHATITDIKPALVVHNQAVKLSAIQITNVTNNSALIVGDNQTYDGIVTVHFTLFQRICLSDIIHNQELGNIIVGQAQQPTEQQIIAKIQQMVPQIVISDLVVYQINPQTAEIIGTDYYYGLVIVQFEISHFQVIPAPSSQLQSQQSCLTDEANNLYLTSETGVIRRLANGQYQHLAGINQTCQLLGFDHNQNLYVAVLISYEHYQIYYFENQQFHEYYQFDGNITSFMVDQANQCYFGFHNGYIIVVKDKQQQTTHFLDGAHLYCLHCSAHGELYAGTSNGVYHYQASSYNLMTFKRISNISDDITQIVTQEQQIFVLSSHQYLYQSSDYNHFQWIPMPTTQLTQIAINQQQRCFIATNQGIYYYDQEKKITKIAGLDLTVTTLICSENQDLWLVSNRQLYLSFH